MSYVRRWPLTWTVWHGREQRMVQKPPEPANDKALVILGPRPQPAARSLPRGKDMARPSRDTGGKSMW